MLSLTLIAALLGPPTAAPTCPVGTTLKETVKGQTKDQACTNAQGLRHGPTVRWSGAQAVLATHYVQGRRQGALEAWFADGSARMTGAYDGGRRVGKWAFWDVAGWRREGPMQGDVFHGPWAVLDPSGQKRAAGAYTRGLRDGAWQWFTKDGPAISGSYDRGRFIMCDGACTLLQPQIEIEEAVKGLDAQAQACYRTQQRAEPTLAGDVEIHWQIGADGSATEIKTVGGTLPVGPARACLEDAVAKIRVVPPRDGRPVAARRVWTFRPKSGFTDEITTDGPCRAKALRPVINPARKGLIRCIKASRPWPPPKAGEVAMRWHIADGAVRGVGVTPDDEAGLVSCLAKQVEAWTFPNLNGCQVRYTLRYQ
jgi:hypothetical protein